jgi:peptidoglycan/xylan/chitin deacetylase (PgdA/CDA1 family)
LFLPSCVTTTPVNKGAEVAVYKSDNYMIYRLQGSETPEDLAKKYLGDIKKSWRIEEANPKKKFSAGQYIVIPFKEDNKGGISTNGYQVIPVLTYHRFNEKCDSDLCMPENVFEQQMKYLKDNGYHSVTPDDLLAFLQYRKALPAKSVMITMDDGFRSVYGIAYPIMKKYGFTATLFIYTDYVGVSGSAITWDQLREMKAAGFSVGSHTVSHSNLTKKAEGESDQDFLARIRKELNESKAIIDKKLGQDTIILAYPFGSCDQRVTEYTKQAGYKMAMTVKRGGNAFFNSPLALKRDQILSADSDLFHSTLITFNRF